MSSMTLTITSSDITVTSVPVSTNFVKVGTVIADYYIVSVTSTGDADDVEIGYPFSARYLLLSTKCGKCLVSTFLRWHGVGWD